MTMLSISSGRSNQTSIQILALTIIPLQLWLETWWRNFTTIEIFHSYLYLFLLFLLESISIHLWNVAWKPAFLTVLFISWSDRKAPPIVVSVYIWKTRLLRSIDLHTKLTTIASASWDSSGNQIEAHSPIIYNINYL